MNRPLLAICDTERDYCRRLDEYLRDHLNLSFEICSFTDTEIFKEFVKEKIPALSVLSQSVYSALSEGGGIKAVKNIQLLDEASTYATVNESHEADTDVWTIMKYIRARQLTDSR